MRCICGEHEEFVKPDFFDGDWKESAKHVGFTFDLLIYVDT